MSTQEHPRHARSYLYSPATTIGAWAADKLTAFMGSWWFVSIHVLWFGLWFLLRVEPFPFGFLTLCVSLEAIFLSTFVLISQNRQASRDRNRDDVEASEIQTMFENHELLLTINKQQLEILQTMHTLIETRKSRKKSPV